MASGPAGETSVLLSAGLSLMVFVLYFASILVAVPKHWGVPYKDRLSRYLARSRSGLAVEALNACFSLATCVLFVLETYSYGSDYDFIVLSFSLEMVFNGFFLCNFILHLYLALDKLIHLVSLQALVDIVTVFPSYLILFVNDGWRTSDGGFADAYLGLKITRVIRVARLLVAISFFAQGPSLAFDHSRQILVLRSQLLRWSLKTAVVIFLLAGLSNFLVEVQDADWGTGEGTMPFHDALYFVIVSFSTVGYGDISPSTPLSRLVITGLILTLFFCVPVVTNAIYDVIRLRPKHGGRLPKHCGTGHVVVGCDASCLRQISILLKDLLSADSMAYHNAHVVLVVPQEPTLAWEALLCLQPSSAVSYLNGDLRSAEDLRRARVQDARCVFVVSDRLAPDTEAQDKTALVRALCANQASPPGGPSVLCLVTHIKSKNRLVRLGMPSASVVCYDEVMEELVTNACLNPGFSTVWANLMSCNPEAEFLLKAREADIEASRGPESTVVYETEMEYLRSLQRVTIRFRLDAFAGEPVGDVTIELYENCSCTLFALIGAVVGSDGHEGGAKGGGGKRGGRRRARVHPEYDTVVKEGDVGVFIGASHKTADLLARYCMGRGPSGQDSARRGRSESMPKTTIASKQGVSRSGARGPGGGSGSGSGGGDGPVVASLNSSSSVDESLVATPPGVVLVIAQSLSYALGVVLALCEAGAGCGSEGSDGIPTSNSTVSVLCSTVWWDPADDEPAERELASRFPGVRLVKQEVDCRSLTAVGAGTADLVCVVASRPEEDAPAALTLGGGGLGESIGRGQGSDAWALGVAVDVLGLVPESTRVVVRFDDSTSAEQHQVVSAHVRRRTDARGTAGRDGRAAGDGGGEEKGEGEEERAQPGVGAQPEGTRPATGPAAAAAAAGAPHSDLSPRETAGQSNASALAPRKWSAGMLVEDSEFFGDWVGGVSEACGAGGEVYFDDTRGAVHEGFDDYFGTQSGYVSGDVVIGNAAELLLLQTMLAADVQSLMGDALSLVSRVAIENLWPQHHPFGARSTPARSRARPQTYGAAYRSLLEERDLLALGIHRPPARRGDGSAATSDGRRTCPGGSRYVAINCPDASFALRDGDFIFVLRRTTNRSVSKGAVAPKVAR